MGAHKASQKSSAAVAGTGIDIAMSSIDSLILVDMYLYLLVKHQV